MKKLTTYLLAIALLAFMVSCGGGAKTEETASEDAESTDAVSEEEVSKYSKETAVGVFHKVNDVAAWTVGYEADSDSSARIGVWASQDDPNMLVVFQWTESHQASMDMFASERMKSVMDSAGVTGEVKYQYYDLVFNSGEGTAGTYLIAGNHEVSDFASWKESFDADEPMRQENGLTLEAMATSADNANLVYLFFSTNDVDKAMAMLTGDDLKKVMEEAGVISELNLSVWVAPGS